MSEKESVKTSWASFLSSVPPDEAGEGGSCRAMGHKGKPPPLGSTVPRCSPPPESGFPMANLRTRGTRRHRWSK